MSSDNFNRGEPVRNRSRIHPLVATAAGAVIVACGVGVAAMTGLLPGARSTSNPPIAATAPLAPPATPSLSAAAATQSPTTAPVVAPSPSRPSAPPPPMQVAQAAPPRPAPAPATVCHSCGMVTSVAEYKTQGHGTGIGAAGGAVAGGLVGHAFGGGNGRVATTLLGALGGGLAGNSIERHVRSTVSYRVYVRMEDGKTRYFTYSNPPPVAQGARVHVVNGVLRTG